MHININDAAIIHETSSVCWLSLEADWHEACVDAFFLAFTLCAKPHMNERGDDEGSRELASLTNNGIQCVTALGPTIFYAAEKWHFR